MDNQPAKDLVVNNSTPVFTYKSIDGSLSPSNQKSVITVKRRNLQSNTETICTKIHLP